MTDVKRCALVIGASSAIAQALIDNLLLDDELQVYAVSRSFPADFSDRMLNQKKLNLIECEYNSAQINAIIEKIKATSLPCVKVFICNGMLHNHSFLPEKKIEQFSADIFQQVMHVNAVVPGLWLQQLITLLRHPLPCVVTVFSARVGSISDNRVGGWYSYRASKAALNMLVKTAAIEYARRAKNVRLIVFHPGTTDTKLSRPFQSNVAPEKLFKPEFVATQLLSLIKPLALENYVSDNKAAFIDWQGKKIEW
ncbi:oxidoreductase, short-chain dehydrogenase/reductase family protein [Psychromonas ingrahamii 37]|uniref:Oxidoreductase, short-chain dehydrogenase/reductase family protein n=1 Tax=Psychromonas ingrahamii (strain DSM 17664 / CCUG 51855 / 37) TaxID=357804 RepID=A1SWJ0_PSYIN|nr:SDR family NAD(P)-dependent oxidoreductase [Psychromonas ingrahamii]ABM03855.1 oxidoreductase, short-chain dehydrogenase/reductase family protein [Psychromonas ingrahamii 37]